MTTVAVSRPMRAHAPGAYDRVFYTTMAVLMALTAFAGFAPTFYLRGYFGAPVTISGSTTLSPLTQVHGALFSAWVLLFIVQTALVANRRVAVHRRLGIAGVVLAAAMIVAGFNTAIASAARGAHPPGAEPLPFLVVPLFDIALFTIFVSLAVWKRREKESHKRLMLLAYVSIITAAVARIPGVFPYGPFAFFGLSFLFVVAGAAYDMATRRRVHPVYLWGGALIAVSVPGRLMLSGTQAWLSFAQFLVR
jgi:hypothetical protein